MERVNQNNVISKLVHRLSLTFKLLWRLHLFIRIKKKFPSNYTAVTLLLYKQLALIRWYSEMLECPTIKLLFLRNIELIHALIVRLDKQYKLSNF